MNVRFVLVWVALALAAGALAGCVGAPTGTTPAPADPTTSGQPSQQPSQEPSQQPSQEPGQGPSRDAASWTMPDLVGLNLQAAQNAMQALTGDPLFFTTSTDATGSRRAQLIDANWTVCAQNVAPGTTIGIAAKIEFAAVKVTEHCP